MLRDALGSTIGLVNSAGAIATPYSYGPFGQQAAQQGPPSSTNPFQYTGRETDATGLYFMRARYYNPIAQRFISQDPIGLLGGQVNFYAYVGNNAMNWTDPIGLLGGSVDVHLPGAAIGDCGGDCGQLEFTIGQTPTSGILEVVLNKNQVLELPQATPTATPDFTDLGDYVTNRSSESDAVLIKQLEQEGVPAALARDMVTHRFGHGVQATPYGYTTPAPPIAAPTPPTE
jgi:RHS repeat-associated protein